VATTNIRNFVRDGVKHGAIGMLNTDWKDDGESLNAPSWHGYAWGAECAWNGSTTAPEDFNRRIGAVLFGEAGERFGRAIERLSQVHRLAGMEGMNNRRFWINDFLPERPPSAIRASANQLLEIVRPAIEDLEACRADAAHEGELLDTFLHGARRMELIGQRMLDGLQAAELYSRAADLPASDAVRWWPRPKRWCGRIATLTDARSAIRGTVAAGVQAVRVGLDERSDTMPWCSGTKRWPLDWAKHVSKPKQAAVCRVPTTWGWPSPRRFRVEPGRTKCSMCRWISDAVWQDHRSHAPAGNRRASRNGRTSRAAGRSTGVAARRIWRPLRSAPSAKCPGPSPRKSPPSWTPPDHRNAGAWSR
jgi:hypothetical protein